MAQIRKRGNAYTISVLVSTDIYGNKIMKHTTFKPTETTPKKIEKEVALFAADFESKVKSGLYLDGEKVKFAEFVKRWQTDYADINLTPRVNQDYRRIINQRLMPVIGNMVMAKIKIIHIQSIYNEMISSGLAPGTVKKVHAVCSCLFNCAFKWGIINENICRRAILPKMDNAKDISCFNSEQASRFLDILSKPIPIKISGHNRTISSGKDSSTCSVKEYVEYKPVHLQFQVFFNLALFGGFRRGELIALTWNDVDFDNNCISITKSTSLIKGGQITKVPKTKAGYRSVTVPSNCIKLLKKWYIQQKEYSVYIGSVWEGSRGKDYDNNYVFIKDTGSQMHIDTPYQKFKSIIKLYNQSCENEADKLPEIRLHDLRHSNATLLISQNVDIKTVSSRLGHSKTSVTLDIYTHALKQLDEKASDALDSLLNQSQA